MRRRQTPDEAPSDSNGFDPEADNHQDYKEVLARAEQEQDFPVSLVERVEISCLANGDATVRVWAVRSDEAIGWTYANPASPREDPL